MVCILPLLLILNYQCISLNTELGKDDNNMSFWTIMFPAHLFLFCFCMIIVLPILFPSWASWQHLQGHNPLSTWFFPSSKAPSRLWLSELLILSPSAVAGALNYYALDMCSVLWLLLLDFSGVNLPRLPLYLLIPFLIFYGSLNSPSPYSQHPQAYSAGRTLLGFGIYFSIYR